MRSAPRKLSMASLPLRALLEASGWALVVLALVVYGVLVLRLEGAD